MASAQVHTIIHHLRHLIRPEASGGLTDGELLERFVGTRDEAAFEVLLWRHGPMV